MIKNIKKFVNEVKAEMKKVSWPTKEQLKESTGVVLGLTAIVSVFILVIDQVFTSVIKLIF